ncbi:MAG: flippase [Candidatus Micrarchaeota archaeon]
MKTKAKNATAPVAIEIGEQLPSSSLSNEEREVAKGSFWGLAGSMVLKLVSFVYAVILARSFNVDDIGVFYLALSIIYVLSIFSDLGMNSTFARYVPFFIGRGEKQKTYTLLRAAYTFSGSLSLFYGIALFLSSGLLANIFKSPALGEMMQIMSIFALLNTFFVLNTAFLGGLKKIKENVILNNFQNAIKLVLTVVLYYFMGPAAVVIPLAFVLSYVFFALLSFYYVRRSVLEIETGFSAPSMREQADIIKETMAFGITLSIIATIWGIFNYTDRLMMGYMLPSDTAASTIGIYSMAVSLGTIVLIFPSSIIAIFMPVITELYGKNKRAEMLSISKTALRWCIFSMVPITITLITFPGELLQTLYGTAYLPGATVLVVFAVGLFLRYLSFIHDAILAAMKTIRVNLYISVFSVVLNIVLNYFWIVPYGMNGAIYATSISLLAVTVLLFYYTKKVAGFGFPKEAYGPLFCGALALVAMFAVRGPALLVVSAIPQIPLFGQPILDLVAQKLVKLAVLGLLFCLSCIFYFVILSTLGSFSKEDISVASGALRKARVPDGMIFLAERAMGNRE